MNELCRTIQAKQAVLDAALDGEPAGDGIDIHDLLAKHLQTQTARGVTR